MTLDRYLTTKKLTHEAFAKEIGVTRAAVSRYVDGTRRPEWRVIAKIVEATGGRVTANSFLSEQSAA